MQVVEKEEDISNEDVEEALQLIKDIPSLASNVSNTLQSVLKRIRNDELPTEKGLSFLDLKNFTFLNYTMNLTYLIQQKFSGKRIENDPAIERIVESRTVYEKMRPIHEKLQYQIDKSSTISGGIDPSNPLRFRANPDSLEAENDEDETEHEEKSKSNVYVPPKISAAYFEEDTSLSGRKKRLLELAQKRALSSSVLYELRKEYDAGPEEIKEHFNVNKIKVNDEMNERVRYEEDYMTRLPKTKKQKHLSRQLMTVSNFDTKFGDISALEMETNDITMKRRSSGRKDKFAKKHGKKKGMKRKH
ncbi:neuroguidin [Nephila pilipes]|uniref:Neuroguidin n=1 Tax=Nephila pilipes TaxID=299642 RepID=A0A8X6MW11_NEPPI|nr:neuroguidin [Nephila pilipes]